MSYASQADELYTQHFKGQGLPPKHVVQVKKLMAAALRKGEKPLNAAKAFLKEKGVVAKKVEEAPPPKKVSKAATAMAVLKTPVATDGQLRKATLLSGLAELKKSGVPVKYSKSDDEETLCKAYNKSINVLVTPKALGQLANIDPGKLAKLEGSPDCFGLYFNQSAVCTDGDDGCPSQEKCLVKFVKNVGAKFAPFKAAMEDIRTEEMAKRVTDDAVSNDEKPKAKKPSIKTKRAFDPEAPIGIIDQKLSKLVVRGDYDSDEEYETFKSLYERILDDETFPETLAELRGIFSEFFEQTEAEFMETVYELVRNKVIQYPTK